MHPCFQDIYVTLEAREALRYEGTREGDRWLDGILKTPDGRAYAEVRGGVPLFVPLDQDPWGDDEAVAALLEEHGVRRETLIPANWQSAVEAWRSAKERSRAWVERVAAQGGLTLIVACGPGGSHAPALLELNPESKLLMDDIGRWVVQNWQRFADEKGTWPYLSCAQFDAQRFPIRDGCLDCIDSSGALSEIEGASLTLHEAFRTLKSGGKLYLSEGMIDPACIAAFPEEGRQELREHGFDQAGVGYKEQLLAIGFDVVADHQWGPTTPNLGRSTLADIADKYGVQIRILGVEIEAQKP